MLFEFPAVPADDDGGGRQVSDGRMVDESVCKPDGVSKDAAIIPNSPRASPTTSPISLVIHCSRPSRGAYSTSPSPLPFLSLLAFAPRLRFGTTTRRLTRGNGEVEGKREESVRSNAVSMAPCDEADFDLEDVGSVGVASPSPISPSISSSDSLYPCTS